MKSSNTSFFINAKKNPNNKRNGYCCRMKLTACFNLMFQLRPDYITSKITTNMYRNKLLKPNQGFKNIKQKNL